MKHQQHPLISPVLGTRRVIDSFHFGTPGCGRKIYIQASLHADELPGMLAAWKLKQQLHELEAQGCIQGEIIVVPVANPVGQNQHLMDVHLGRYETETGQNFNRGYYDTYAQVADLVENQLSDDPQENKKIIRLALRQAIQSWQVETEMHSMQKTLQSLCCDADVIIDMHCDFEAVQHVYSTYYSWESMIPLACWLDSKANMLADETGGNPFDSAFDMVWQRLHARFGDIIPKGCQSVTLELCGQADVSHNKSNQDAEALLNYLRHLEVLIDRAADEYDPQTLYVSDLTAVEPLKSPFGGVVVLCAEVGEQVTAGQLIAEVIDPVTDEVAQIRATHPGLLFSRTMRRTATAGMLVAHVAGEIPVRSGYLLAP
ncbi:Succinylglutamate desuccinylase / Aspartoacylase family protein [Vibrio aerogenes CECT 7868]|uniref:Succinylglutamate desuccinylase / Aspartoacylase family protein n=1 Tax=Vibrio aerogenes CECT 7868 TaxID=1216006 RepID=A0A1M5VCE0_9VIBR|nr:succinylglutamate desuccinylase/aspartoacylase family protein [Vibrio aerogenes]SHH72573.1 Succinylglutamate desuccinylase / Aspartoacylase family protein [Vibrio aerogenes CECT 7868]